MFRRLFSILLYLVYRKVERDFLEEATRRGLCKPDADQQVEALHKEALAFLADTPDALPPALETPRPSAPLPALRPPAPPEDGAPLPKRRGRPPKLRPSEEHHDPDFADLV